MNYTKGNEARAFRLIEAVANGSITQAWSLVASRHDGRPCLEFCPAEGAPVEAFIRERGWRISWQAWAKSTKSEDIEDDKEAAQMVVDFLRNEEWITK